jgi:hypothetical protein
MGRKSTYTPEIAKEICHRLAHGESLTGICRDKHMPSEFAVRNWAMQDVQGFASLYARARQDQANHLAESIIEIADNATDANLARLQIDARRWFAAKVAPKSWGDNLQVSVTHTLDLTTALTEARQRLKRLENGPIIDAIPSNHGDSVLIQQSTCDSVAD